MSEAADAGAAGGRDSVRVIPIDACVRSVVVLPTRIARWPRRAPYFICVAHQVMMARTDEQFDSALELLLGLSHVTQDQTAM
jgi:hypothetical protein